jgi:CRISPR-associated endoribonuclease Cas6
MRLAVEYEMKSEYLPKDYRRGFLSLIKKSIESANQTLFDQYYSSRRLKPFTFSLYFPGLEGNDGDKFKVGNSVRVNFSTSSLELATCLYNGFLKTKTFGLFQNTPGFENMLSMKRILLIRSEQIRADEAIFKTESPVLVNNKGKSNWYLVPGEEGFMEGLRFAVTETAKEFLDWKGEVPLEFEVFQRDGEVSVKRKIVSHYEQSMSAFVGAFKIRSEPKILQLIYDVGLGVRRSQGFGMLEVVRQ